MADTTITPEMQAWLDAGNKPKAKPQAAPVFQPDADVNVISPDGEAGTVKGSTVDSFLRAGYQLEDSAGTHERVLKKEYGDSPILAGTLGAARGATLGLSDLAIRGFGGREAADALERLNPVSSTIGELGGALAGSFIPGMGFIGGAGHAAEEAVAGSRVVRSFAEGGKFAQAAARYAPTLARGAVEGAIYGAGGGLSQAALSSDPMTAEAVLGDMATGALIGAPMGAAMAAGGKFLSETSAWARKAHAEAAADSLTPVEAQAAEVVGTSPTPKAEGLPKYHEVNPDATYTTTAAELEAAGIHELPGARVNEGRMNRVREGLGKPEAFDQPIRLTMDENGKYFVENGRHRLGALLEEGGSRPIEVKIDRGVPGFDASENSVRLTRPAEPVADGFVEDFKTKYHRATVASRQNIRQYEGLVKKGADISPELEQAVQDLEAARAKTQSMLPTEGSKDASRTYEVSEKTGKQGRISREMWTADNKGIAEAAQQPGFREAMAEHQQALDRVQKLLGNKEYPAIVEADHPIYGKRGGGGSYNGLSAEARALAEGLERPPAASKSTGKRMDPAKAADLFGVEMPTKAEAAAGEKVGKLAGEATVKTGGHEEESGLSKALSPILGKHAPEMANRLIHHASTGAVHSLENAAFQLLGIGGGYSLGALAHRYVHHETGSNMLGYLAGAVAGVPLAMLMSHTIRAPLAMLMKGKLNISELLTGRAGAGVSKLADGVDALLAGQRKAAVLKRSANAILGGAVFGVVQSPEHKKGTVFQQRSAELTQTLANPMEARRQIHNNLAGVRAADPMLSDQMEELAFARLMFLGEKMPKDPGAGAQLGKRKPWQPADSEIIRWARYIEASEHPETVLHSVADGTVTLEQVETLQTLYPVTYQRVRSDIVARTAEMQRELTWDQRLSLGVLFGVPTDDILRPENVTAMQANFQPSEPDKPVNGAKMPSIKPPEGTRAQQLASH